VGTWHDVDVGRPLVAPLEQCAQLLDVDLATVRELAAKVEPYLRADSTRIWSLTQLERQLRPEVYGRRRGGYSTVDERGSSTYRPDKADQYFQQPQWPTPTSKNTIESRAEPAGRKGQAALSTTTLLNVIERDHPSEQLPWSRNSPQLTSSTLMKDSAGPLGRSNGPATCAPDRLLSTPASPALGP